jgi:hypothetical protein
MLIPIFKILFFIIACNLVITVIVKKSLQPYSKVYCEFHCKKSALCLCRHIPTWVVDSIHIRCGCVINRYESKLIEWEFSNGAILDFTTLWWFPCSSIDSSSGKPLSPLVAPLINFDNKTKQKTNQENLEETISCPIGTCVGHWHPWHLANTPNAWNNDF